jgi:DNA-binding transcriptional LysR family regulator
LWLPLDADDIAVRVLIAEPRYAALSARHPLAGRREITFADIADEPFAALPALPAPARVLPCFRPAGRQACDRRC